MKPPERFPPDDPREWLNRARSNLVKARHRMPEVYLEDLCFEAQQAAEKAIKAVKRWSAGRRNRCDLPPLQAADDRDPGRRATASNK